MRALSDALPTGRRAMANPTLQLHFGCGRATPPISHSHNWPSGRMQHFLFKIGRKKLFFAHKDPKTNFDAWMILQKPVLSFKGNDLKKMANLKVISSSATLNDSHRHLELPVNRLFVYQFVETINKETSKVHVTVPFWGESTDDRWIPRTKGQ